MDQIKLEVGKPYISREGEEVKIVKKTDVGSYLYKGSNGEWYTESGSCEAFGREHPHDLIKEVGSPRHTFDIPNGVQKVTVSQEGNRIIVEMVPEKVEPKPGDVMIDAKGNVYIFKSVVGDIHKHFAGFWKDGRLVIGTWCNPGRPATPEEAQPLFDALQKAGKRWNAEAMVVEEIPEKEQIEKFLKSYIDGVIWSHEQLCSLIEGYLKHKEGKK